MTMKKLIYIASAVVAMILSASCTKESADKTRITYYPVLELAGDTRIILDKGTSFAEPGFSATLNGEDVTDQVKVESNVDPQISGVYEVAYSIVNADGFSSKAYRQVIVLDPNDPIEGFYYTDPSSYRLYNGVKTAYGSDFEILVICQGEGVYYVDDLLGGWYCQRAGYGDNYKMNGIVEIDGDGVIELLDSYIGGWGDSLVDWADGKFEDGTITYMAQYVSGMQFYVTMSK